MSQAASMCCQFHGQVFAVGLNHLVDRYGAPRFEELVDAILEQGCRDPQLARSLARGFVHYFNADYESCASVVIPKFEAAARSLLRELDEGIYRVQVGDDPGGYVGLYNLLDELEKLALDESWAILLSMAPAGAIRREPAQRRCARLRLRSRPRVRSAPPSSRIRRRARRRHAPRGRLPSDGRH